MEGAPSCSNLLLQTPSLRLQIRAVGRSCPVPPEGCKGRLNSGDEDGSVRVRRDIPSNRGNRGQGLYDRRCMFGGRKVTDPESAPASTPAARARRQRHCNGDSGGHMIRTTVSRMQTRGRKGGASPVDPRPGHAHIIDTAQTASSLLCVGVGGTPVAISKGGGRTTIYISQEGVQVFPGNILSLSPQQPYMSRRHGSQRGVAIARKDNEVIAAVLLDQSIMVQSHHSSRAQPSVAR